MPGSGWALAPGSLTVSGPRHILPWLDHSQAITGTRQVGNKYCRIAGHRKRSSWSGDSVWTDFNWCKQVFLGRAVLRWLGVCHPLTHIKVPLPSACRKSRINYSSFFWNGKREIKLWHQILAPSELLWSLGWRRELGAQVSVGETPGEWGEGTDCCTMCGPPRWHSLSLYWLRRLSKYFLSAWAF